jgi:hypothetical protein
MPKTKFVFVVNCWAVIVRGSLGSSNIGLGNEFIGKFIGKAETKPRWIGKGGTPVKVYVKVTVPLPHRVWLAIGLAGGAGIMLTENCFLGLSHPVRVSKLLTQ